ncbi:hypothetical protein MMC17_001644 [Xylographa soralifera]|nr:hypothetical protein [Xylographa soralifera]
MSILSFVKHIFEKVRTKLTRGRKTPPPRSLVIGPPTNVHRSQINLPGATMEEMMAEHELYVQMVAADGGW